MFKIRNKISLVYSIHSIRIPNRSCLRSSSFNRKFVYCVKHSFAKRFFLILVHFFEIFYPLLFFWLNCSRCFKRAWRRIFSRSTFPSAFDNLVKGAKEKCVDWWLIESSSTNYVVQLCWWIWYKHIFWITERNSVVCQFL